MLSLLLCVALSLKPLQCWGSALPLSCTPKPLRLNVPITFTLLTDMCGDKTGGKSSPGHHYHEDLMQVSLAASTFPQEPSESLCLSDFLLSPGATGGGAQLRQYVLTGFLHHT